MAEYTHQKLQENEEHTGSVTFRAFHLFIEQAKTIDGVTDNTISYLRNLFEKETTETPEDVFDALITSRTQHSAE